MNPTACRIIIALLLLAMIPALDAADATSFTSYGTRGAHVVVSQGGTDYLQFNVVGWGPNWAYTGFGGPLKSDNGAATGEWTAKLGGTGVPLKLNFRAARTTPRQLRMQYELVSTADTDLTLIIVELAPGKLFEKRPFSFEAGGKTGTASFPLDKRGIGNQVTSMKLTDPAGASTTIRFDPPADVASDGAARIVLAREKLAKGDVKTQTVTVELPADTDWYPTAAELPDEPGIATWYPWQATGAVKDSMLSLADWIEAPAGKHGRILRDNDKLMYNAKPIKLWGLNLCYSDTAPPRELADARAAFYRKNGINSVRLHKYADGAGWSGIQAKDTCTDFDPAGLDRMDYQVARFKEAGIYVKLSPIFGSLKLGPADKGMVPFMDEFGKHKGNRIETPHSAIHYSPELQAVLLKQTTNLLKHKNPHTGLTYAEDPAIAYVEIINEQSILFYTSMAPLKASATLRKQVGARFCDWLKKKYADAAGLEKAWGKGALNAFANDVKGDPEDLDKGTILPLGNPWYWDPEQLKGAQAARRQRNLDTLHFLYTLQYEFFDRFVKGIREAGYKGEILSSNWQAGRALSHFANLHSDWTVGTIDRHNYFGGKRANASMLARAGSGMLSSGMQQAADRPFMLSEWIHVFPGEYGIEGPTIIGAYGLGLQGWDVSYMFQNRDAATFSKQLKDTWDVMAPQVMGVFPAVSRQVHRGDVKESDVIAIRNVHAPSLFEGRLGFEDKVEQGYDDKELDSNKVPARALAVARSVVAFTPQYVETPVFDIKKYEQNGVLASSTGQLRWKEKDATTGGYFTMNTPGTRAVVGWAAGQKLELGNVTIEPQSNFAAIYITAREPDKTIETSKELLIVALARARNTGMKFTPAGERMLAAGAAPIVMEPVKARITIKGPAVAQLIVLDHDGKPTASTQPIGGGVFTVDTAASKTPYFLIR